MTMSIRPPQSVTRSASVVRSWASERSGAILGRVLEGSLLVAIVGALAAGIFHIR